MMRNRIRIILQDLILKEQCREIFCSFFKSKTNFRDYIRKIRFREVDYAESVSDYKFHLRYFGFLVLQQVCVTDPGRQI